MSEQYRKFRIILKSGKELEINIRDENFINNLVKAAEENIEGEISIYMDDIDKKNFFVRLSEIAAISEI